MTIDPKDAEHTRCPYCDADDAAPWGQENGWTAVKCAQCGIVYLNPRPRPSEITSSTRMGLHRTEAGSLDVREKFRQSRVGKLRRRVLEQFDTDELAQRPIKWLDVGAGFGELVMALMPITHPASTVDGVEPCRHKVERARSLGLPVCLRTLGEVEAGRYDYVSLINVFSHVPDPREFVSEVITKLGPGGELLLVTGNGGDIDVADYPQRLQLPDHLVFAGQKHVVSILEGAGLSVVSVKDYRTSRPRPALAEHAERLLSRALQRRVGHSGAFRSLWVRARRPS